MKKCTKCGKEKPLDEFHKWAKSRGGHRSQCKECRKENRRRKFQPSSKTKEEYDNLHSLRSLETPGTQVCTMCLDIKPLRDFAPLKSGRKNVSSCCKLCDCTRANASYSTEDRHLRSLANYGLTQEGYDQLSESQDNKCAVCGALEGRTNVGLYVDHDHRTGKIRGLLCGNCNTGIGMLGDNLERLEAAAAYLRKHKHA